MSLRPRPPAEGYKHVRVPNFVTRDEFGRITEIRCPLCGTVISAVTSKTIGHYTDAVGQKVEQVETRIAPNANFAQIMIELENGQRHETTTCKRCIAGRVKPDVLHELMMLDFEEQGLELTAARLVESRRATKAIGRVDLDLQKMRYVR